MNKNCDLKICDFGLARGLVSASDEPGQEDNLTDYVVTRWYRAPEVVLLASEYTKVIDIWAVGCILCELIGRRPFFTGKDHLDQIKKIFAVIGSPSEEDLDWLPPKSPARGFLAKIPKHAKKPWSSALSCSAPTSQKGQLPRCREVIGPFTLVAERSSALSRSAPTL